MRALLKVSSRPAPSRRAYLGGSAHADRLFLPTASCNDPCQDTRCQLAYSLEAA